MDNCLYNILTAVSQDGNALEFASEELKNDRNFSLTTVSTSCLEGTTPLRIKGVKEQQASSSLQKNNNDKSIMNLAQQMQKQREMEDSKKPV